MYVPLRFSKSTIFASPGPESRQALADHRAPTGLSVTSLAVAGFQQFRPGQFGFGLVELGLGRLALGNEIGLRVLQIVAPLARESQRVSIGDLAKLGLIGGVPTIAGAWLGGFVYSPVWSVLFLEVGVGAIAQVVVQIVRHKTREGSVARVLATGPVLAGLFAGFAVMYVTGMLVG